MSTLRRRTTYAAIGAVWVVAAVAGAAAGFVQSLGPAPLGDDLETSQTVVDRNGKLLRLGRGLLSDLPAHSQILRPYLLQVLRYSCLHWRGFWYVFFFFFYFSFFFDSIYYTGYTIDTVW